MRSWLLVSIPVLAVAIGCSSAQQKLTGSWKGEIAHKNSPDNLGEGIKSFFAGMIGPVTFEFNGKGRYKMTVMGVSEEGDYTISGNEVKTVSDNGKSHSIFVLNDDGSKLSQKKDFKSDEDFVLNKQPN